MLEVCVVRYQKPYGTFEAHVTTYSIVTQKFIRSTLLCNNRDEHALKHKVESQYRLYSIFMSFHCITFMFLSLRIHRIVSPKLLIRYYMRHFNSFSPQGAVLCSLVLFYSIFFQAQCSPLSFKFSSIHLIQSAKTREKVPLTK